MSGQALERPLPKKRGVAFAIVLSIVTLGLYTIYWIYRTFKELRNYRGEGVGGVLGVLSCFVVVGVFLLPHYVGRLALATDKPSKGWVSAWTGLWNLVPLIGGYIWIGAIQSALNAFIESGRAEATGITLRELEEQRQIEEFGGRECPHCGAFSADDATQCRKCRQPLTQ